MTSVRRPSRGCGLALALPFAIVAAVLVLMPHGGAAAAEHTVVIRAMAFTPQTLSVRQGDTVVWVNEDFFPHTATAADGGFDSGSIAAGSAWRYVVNRRGAFDYVCTLHPTMKAVLIVE